VYPGLSHCETPSLSLAPLITAALALLPLLGPGPAAAGPAAAPYAATETEVQAAFLYHFAQLVTWPDEPWTGASPPLVVAVLGRDPFGDRLEAIIGRQSVRGRPIRIVRARTLQDLSLTPNVVFVGAGRLTEARRILAALPQAPILTVASVPDFAAHGGMVEFVLTPDARVTFDINLRAVERAGLKMSSQLLKIARNVGPPP
jgi:hypothetical protein